MNQEAQKSNELIYGTSEEHATIQTKLESGSAESVATIKDMFSSMYLKVFIIGCVLSIVQQLSGINAVVFFSTDLFKGG